MKLPELITWGRAHALLMERGLSYDAARRALRNSIADVPHGLHKRKLWRSKDVVAFADALTQPEAGKGGNVPTTP